MESTEDNAVFPVFDALPIPSLPIIDEIAGEFGDEGEERSELESVDGKKGIEIINVATNDYILEETNGENLADEAFPVYDALPTVDDIESEFGDEGEERAEQEQGKKGIEFSNFPAAH